MCVIDELTLPDNLTDKETELQVSLTSLVLVTHSALQEFLGGSDPKNVKQLIKKQAEWCETTNDPKAAV